MAVRVTITPSPPISLSVTEKGSKGDTGAAGATGPTGAAGQGVPVGGSLNQSLKKASSTDYDTEWGNSYIGNYNTQAATLRSGATATLELYYTAQADGDGISELSQSDTPTTDYQIIRKLYYAERAQQDPDTGTWVQFADVAANTSFNDAKNTLLAYLKERTGGTVPISLKMTWEEVEIYNGLLDSYGGAAAAYSVRRLSSTYTGPLIEVERASDSTTQDIGYDANGDLDTTALTTFCSGTTCTVRTWYDQSSNGNDAEQTTAANQPKIYDSSTGVVTENGKPAVELNGTTSVLGITDSFSSSVIFGFAVVADVSSAGTRDVWSNLDAFNDGVQMRSIASTQTIQLALDSTDTSFVHSSSGQLLSVYGYDGSTVTLAVDGTSTTAAVSETISVSSVSSLGGRLSPSLGAIIEGTLQEFVLYTSDESTNRSGIETNINDYFGIYTPFTTGLLDDYGGAAAAYSLRRLSSTYTGPLIRVRRASDNAEQDISADIEGNLNTGALAAFCAGTDGFVKTWYCQSGNANDATQTTTSNQPKIYDSVTGVVTENSKPAVEFDGTNDGFKVSYTSTAVDAVSMFAVTAGTTRGQIFGAQDTSTGVRMYSAGSTNRRWEVRGGGTNTYQYNGINGQAQMTGLFIANSQKAYENGVSKVTATTAYTGYYLNDICIGQRSTNAEYTDAKIQEFFFYGSDQSSNRTGIETNINDFYTIYP